MAMSYGYTLNSNHDPRYLGINQPTIITHITVTITLETLETNLVHVNFDASVPVTLQVPRANVG
jgi:hypothetical protein